MAQQNPEPTWLTYDDVARMLGCSRRTVGRLAQSGDLTVYRFGARTVRTTRAAVEALAERLAEGGDR